MRKKSAENITADQAEAQALEVSRQKYKTIMREKKITYNMLAAEVGMTSRTMRFWLSDAKHFAAHAAKLGDAMSAVIDKRLTDEATEEHESPDPAPAPDPEPIPVLLPEIPIPKDVGLKDGTALFKTARTNALGVIRDLANTMHVRHRELSDTAYDALIFGLITQDEHSRILDITLAADKYNEALTKLEIYMEEAKDADC